MHFPLQLSLRNNIFSLNFAEQALKRYRPFMSRARARLTYLMIVSRMRLSLRFRLLMMSRSL